uniref:Protein kinase shaggy n=1 Tax=Anopheles marajoara TaxID=58244 RepID=A0A2M4CDZ0_9DIPT
MDFPAFSAALCASVEATTTARSSANAIFFARPGCCAVRTSSYATFHSVGPRTEPWGTPAFTACVLAPRSVS